MSDCRVCDAGPSGQRLHKCPNSKYFTWADFSRVMTSNDSTIELDDLEPEAEWEMEDLGNGRSISRGFGGCATCDGGGCGDCKQ